MIWCSTFFFFLLMKLKMFFFFNSYLSLEVLSTYMILVCPLVLLLIFNLNSFFSFMEENIFISSFFFVVFFVSLCFFFNNPFHFLLGLEMCVFPMILLIFVFSKGSDKIISVFFMFLINIMGSLPFMVFLNGQWFSFLDFKLFNSNSFLIFFFFSLIMICKIPMFLLHFWLTKAHVSASGSCSMILASLMLKLGTFGLLKFSSFFIKISKFNLSFIFSISIWGSLLIMIAMIRFFDMKYLIACSSIVHMAMIFPLVSLNFNLGVISSMFMMVGHGLVSFILFYLISILYEISHNRSFDFNKGIESKLKILSMWIFFFMFLNLGVPPFLNLFSEIFTLVSFLKFSYINCFILVCLMFIPIMFCMQMLSKIIFGKSFHYNNVSVNSTVSNYSMIYIWFLSILPFLFG